MYPRTGIHIHSQEGLAIIVIGASGDLAKKKTYPSLLNLYAENLLPEDAIVYGYARSNMSHDQLRNKLKPYLLTNNQHNEALVDQFLSICFYHSGKSYGDERAYRALVGKLFDHENTIPDRRRHNRLFYWAIPPNVFDETGIVIKKVAMQPTEKGWNRMIIEKPFGRDLESCLKLGDLLSSQFKESELYRIDHYLGKEMVQNLLTLRFGNSYFEYMWNKSAIASVIITFKEDFGTDGRGGYFDKYGIIRDVIQNHLLQVLTLVAMEPPIQVDGAEIGDIIRDAKVKVLQSINPIQLEDCILGQYEGYTNDETIENKETNTPTFATMCCFINNSRWSGVPFILQAGKAMDERKVDVRIQLKDPPASPFLTRKDLKSQRNEIVLNIQPKEGIFMKTNVKTPGFDSVPVQSELEMKYETSFRGKIKSPDAYTRLILDAFRGRQAAFVRDDELVKSWEIFTPVLHEIDESRIQPTIYQPGGNGIKEINELIAKNSASSEADCPSKAFPAGGTINMVRSSAL